MAEVLAKCARCGVSLRQVTLLWTLHDQREQFCSKHCRDQWEEDEHERHRLYSRYPWKREAVRRVGELMVQLYAQCLVEPGAGPQVVFTARS